MKQLASLVPDSSDLRPDQKEKLSSVLGKWVRVAYPNEVYFACNIQRGTTNALSLVLGGVRCRNLSFILEGIFHWVPRHFMRWPDSSFVEFISCPLVA